MSEPAASARQAAQIAVFVTGTRCLLLYVLLPAAGPLAAGLDVVVVPVGIVLHVVSLASVTFAVMRVWGRRARLRVLYGLVGAVAFGLSLTGLVGELTLLIGRTS